LNEQILERAQSLGIRIYQDTIEEGYRVGDWWDHLIQSGDMDRLMPKAEHSLDRFLANFRPPTVLTYTLNWLGEFEIAAWVRAAPTSRKACYLSLWTRDGARVSKRSVRIISTIYEAAFTLFEVICGLTKQSRLLALHRNMGYEVLGPIPMLWDEDSAYIVYLTKQRFFESRFFKVAQKIRS
jgi:hypothetical protein